ncbi:hypothetical protein D3H65_13090 [Paraflavitalea soli]|uniref:DUF4595 domain-containing protein n=1 Tax=Paraflavitalea soli TaxID=2315862 RepID=A0A3B7MNH9_9BACT|nr:hypothetical protein [Paraflavitalea soli]AXY74863.1 hypothetical protein D3H65_13090 [Paraflavitalea soli]
MLKFYLLPVTAGLLLLITSSCQKRHDPNNGTILRQTVIDRPSTGIVATNYVYNEGHDLVRLHMVTNPGERNERKEALVIEMNQEGYLLRSYYAEPGNSAYNIEEYTYRRKLPDTVVSTITIYRFLPPAYTRQVILDKLQRVISDSIRTIANGDINFSTYTWDANGNLAIQRTGLLVNGILRDSSKVIYTYDTRRNPLRGFGVPYYLATRDATVFNTDNVLTWDDGQFRYTWQYKYNINDLPLERMLPIASGQRKHSFYYR